MTVRNSAQDRVDIANAMRSLHESERAVISNASRHFMGQDWWRTYSLEDVAALLLARSRVRGMLTHTQASAVIAFVIVAQVIVWEKENAK